MKAISSVEKLEDALSVLDQIEGVKSIDSILDTLQDRDIFPEITVLVLNSRFELLYLVEEQKVLFLTLEKAITLDVASIDEINLISQHTPAIENALNEIVEAGALRTHM
ncbi:hypothetical protein [Lysinibacillus odysseyi]|uniref:hypothetical protein n=1 Tax=Lysinibacillus odysseyi TaxID=202611 RepID=UPI00068EBBED|nr:hypothetical protein [Lysinibacillus odysseyi]